MFVFKFSKLVACSLGLGLVSSCCNFSSTLAMEGSFSNASNVTNASDAGANIHEQISKGVVKGVVNAFKFGLDNLPHTGFLNFPTIFEFDPQKTLKCAGCKASSPVYRFAEETNHKYNNFYSCVNCKSKICAGCVVEFSKEKKDGCPVCYEYVKAENKRVEKGIDRIFNKYIGQHIDKSNK